TRSTRDWSSDVCSSDLQSTIDPFVSMRYANVKSWPGKLEAAHLKTSIWNLFPSELRISTVSLSFPMENWFFAYFNSGSECLISRSEERRVGKESGSGWS